MSDDILDEFDREDQARRPVRRKRFYRPRGPQKFCCRGHELSDDNVYITTRNNSVERHCKKCMRLRRVAKSAAISSPNRAK